jgi:hypothetical protein
VKTSFDDRDQHFDRERIVPDALSKLHCVDFASTTAPDGNERTRPTPAKLVSHFTSRDLENMRGLVLAQACPRSLNRPTGDCH